MGMLEGHLLTGQPMVLASLSMGVVGELQV